MYKFAIYASSILLCSCHIYDGKAHLKTIKTLPDFNVISITNNQSVNSHILSAGKPIIFFYFSPECEHCQKETRDLIDHIDELRNVKLAWITNDPIDSLKVFYKHFRLDTIPDSFVGSDTKFSFYRIFLPPATPYIAIYDRHQALLKVYYEEVDISNIINVIRG